MSDAAATDGAIELLFLTDLPCSTLHWGVAVRRKGEWTAPPPALRPPDSRAVGDKARRAIHSPHAVGGRECGRARGPWAGRNRPGSLCLGRSRRLAVACAPGACRRARAASSSGRAALKRAWAR